MSWNGGSSRPDGLLLDMRLVAELGLRAAAVDAHLRQWLSVGEERLVTQRHLLEQLQVFFAADDSQGSVGNDTIKDRDEIMEMLELLQKSRRLSKGAGGRGKMPLTMLAVAGGDASCAPLRQGRATAMTLDWQPAPETEQMLAEHEIPAEYWRQQLPGFRLYWHERERERQGYWEYRFFSWIKNGWERGAEEREGAADSFAEHPHWQPSPPELEALRDLGLQDDRIADLVVQFRLDRRNLIGTLEQIESRFASYARYQVELEGACG